MIEITCWNCNHVGEVSSAVRPGQEVVCSDCNVDGIIFFAKNGEAVVKSWSQVLVIAEEKIAESKA